jgi:hypothetical protein
MVYGVELLAIRDLLPFWYASEHEKFVMEILERELLIDVKPYVSFSHMSFGSGYDFGLFVYEQELAAMIKLTYW